LSTVNINWVAESFRDRDFKKAICNSDIVTLDGMPLLWLAKAKRFPFVETVAGSTLMQEILEEKSEKPLTVFLFGGETGVADLAMQRINEKNGGMTAVGALDPGFGSVEGMSSDDIIQRINTTSPDILLVALGAKKGMKWIEMNRERLNVGVVSHLGATINFLAGTVKRAPIIMQNLGLEWVWRIFQEPKLFKRYFSDGLYVLNLLIRRKL
jgi:N-acetylglucosaminyldiphosphoundecaprenol N-acetyl-beta-D-mannosaminyltransferase